MAGRAELTGGHTTRWGRGGRCWPMLEPGTNTSAMEACRTVPRVGTPHSRCGASGFKPWSGNWIWHAATKKENKRTNYVYMYV